MEIDETVEMVEGVLVNMVGGCSGEIKGPSWKTGPVMKMEARRL